MATIAGVLYLTQGQQLQIAGFNLYALRFVEIAGFIRVLSRREFSFSQVNALDRSFILLYFYMTIVFLLRSKDGQANQIGTMVDACFCYFTFRGLLGNSQDLNWFLRAFLILLLPYTLLVLYESLSGQNLFSYLGASAIDSSNWIRGGRVRCWGSFRHPSLLGTLGASFLPIYAGKWFAKTDRKTAALGVILCSIIVWTTNSGGPVSCVAIGIVGWALWVARNKMQLFRRTLVVMIIVIGFLMKAPIWYLPARVSSLTGGDGWHRSYLMNVAFENIDKWWFAGMSLGETAGWFPYDIGGTGGADITNLYLSFGMTAGVFAAILFIVLLTKAYKVLGRSLMLVRSNQEKSQEIEFLLWGMGVVLAVHIFNWLGITYFDQTAAIWFMQLAIISNLSEEITKQYSSQNRSESPQNAGELNSSVHLT